MPKSKCSVPIDACDNLSAAAAAWLKTRFAWSFSGTSTLVEMRSRMVMPASNLLADRFDWQTIDQLFILAQQAEQQVLRPDVGAAILAGFIAREEDNPSGLFGVSFEHR
jgi:hypothetical protein